MRLEIRLALVALITGVAAAVLAGRRPVEQPVADNEPTRGMPADQAPAETEADGWFI